MLITEFVTVKWNPNSKKHYENKGYPFTKMRDSFSVRVEDLPEKSSVIVKVKCDYCGEIIDKKYVKYKKSKALTTNKDSCYACKSKKIKDTHLVLYGVENTFQRNETKDKIKSSIENEYGVEHISQNEFIKNKIMIKNTTTYEEIKQFILDNSKCELITKKENYINVNGHICIKCKCGNSFDTTFVNFKHENKRQCNDCGLKLRSGENSPNWKGGITPELESIRKSKDYCNWREVVFERDNYTCQCCGDNKGGNLHAHHIENFSDHEDVRFDIDNGITLCSNCHNPSIEGSFHHIYGTRNNNREQLEGYIKSKQLCADIL